MQTHNENAMAAQGRDVYKRLRRSSRYPLDIRITVKIFRSGIRLSLWGRSNELGENGIGATVTGEIQAGEVVALELEVPNAVAPLRIRAVVRYREGLRHGFEFLSKTPEQRKTIQCICERLALEAAMREKSSK